jgi:hypothetical protein
LLARETKLAVAITAWIPVDAAVRFFEFVAFLAKREVERVFSARPKATSLPLPVCMLAVEFNASSRNANSSALLLASRAALLFVACSCLFRSALVMNVRLIVLLDVGDVGPLKMTLCFLRTATGARSSSCGT